MTGHQDVWFEQERQLFISICELIINSCLQNHTFSPFLDKQSDIVESAVKHSLPSVFNGLPRSPFVADCPSENKT